MNVSYSYFALHQVGPKTGNKKQKLCLRGFVGNKGVFTCRPTEHDIKDVWLASTLQPEKSFTFIPWVRAIFLRIYSILPVVSE